MRPSWDETWMEVVRAMARRSTCTRRSVGCVIVDRFNNFLSEGFNGVEPGAPHCNEGHPCPAANAASGMNLDGCKAIHAEINALVICRNPWAAHSLYVSVSPCISCLKAVSRTKVKRIVFAEAYVHEAASREMWMVRPDREWVHLP